MSDNMSDKMSDNMIDFVCKQLDELKQQLREKHQQYSTEDALANFRVGAMLSGKQADYPAMYEEAKAYARKHIAHVYAHDIDGVKVDESLKDIALYSLIELYMVKAWEQETAEYQNSDEYRNMVENIKKRYDF